MKAHRTILAQIITASFGFALVACASTPRERMPSRELPYRLPPCAVAPTSGTPCAKPVVRPARQCKVCKIGRESR